MRTCPFCNEKMYDVDTNEPADCSYCNAIDMKPCHCCGWRIMSEYDTFRCCNPDCKNNKPQSITQAAIFNSVKDRGYYDQGLTLEEVGARQMAKLAEELGEAAHAGIYAPRSQTFSGVFADLRDWGRDKFGVISLWKEASIDTGDELGKELADIAVVLFNLSEVYSQLRLADGKEPFSLIEAALKKSKADAKRGVTR